VSRLAAFQRRFVRAVVCGADMDELKGRRGFEVYRRNAVFAAADAFELLFPSVRAALGLQNLRFFVRELLAAEPPATPSWLDAARPFPDFLRGRPELAALPFLGDLARLDWLVARAIRQPHAVPMSAPTADELAAAASADDLLALHAMRTDFAVAALRRAGEAAWREPEPVAVERVPTHWVCLRRGPEGVRVEVVVPP
jgi:hypothetical protein